MLIDDPLNLQPFRFGWRHSIRRKGTGVKVYL